MGRLVPLSDTHLDADVVADLALKKVEVCKRLVLVTKVIWINHLWPELTDCTHRLAHIHREWNVHWQKCNIDVLQGAHFWNVARIASHVDAAAADGDDIAIAAPEGHG